MSAGVSAYVVQQSSSCSVLADTTSPREHLNTSARERDTIYSFAALIC